MSDPRGWVPAWRKLYDPSHKLAPSKRDPANRRDAWLDLCQMAQHADHSQNGIPLRRGEVLVAVRTKAEHWGWSKSRVSRFLLWLASEAMIGTVTGTPYGTVYRIVNYDTYAPSQIPARDSERDSERDASGTAAGQEQEQKNRRTQITTSLRSVDDNGNGVALSGWDNPTPGAWNGAHVLAAYVEFCRRKGWSDPPNGHRGKLGAAGKRIAEKASPAEIVAAMVGMDALFPHSNGEPWDLFDLERKFTKAVAAAQTHPEIAKRRFAQEFMAL